MADSPDKPETPPRSATDLLPLVYRQLQQLAELRMRREGPGHDLDAPALVHETYLRLAGGKDHPPEFANSAHFYAAAAEAMRRILIDHARVAGRQKPRGSRQRLNLSQILDLSSTPEADDVIALDEAISRLEVEAPDAAQVVRLRFYAGLSVNETAEALRVSSRTVDREWAYARAWLYQQLRSADTAEPERKMQPEAPTEASGSGDEMDAVAPATPLSLFFDLTDFTPSEVAEAIGLLSDLYRSVGGDRLIIEGTTLLERVPDLEPVGA